jgi:hypothetical protein
LPVLRGFTASNPQSEGQYEQGAFERQYRIGEIAEIWGLGRETVRLLFMEEPGVIKISMGRKKKHTTYSIPATVARRVHTRLLNEK